MNDYVCVSHNRRKCPDSVCRARAVRAGYVAPSTARKPVAAAVATPVRQDPEVLWVGSPITVYGRDGATSESVAHRVGAPCGKAGASATELPEGWGVIEDPTAYSRLANGEHLKTTDGADLVATGMCVVCARS